MTFRLFILWCPLARAFSGFSSALNNMATHSVCVSVRCCVLSFVFRFPTIAFARPFLQQYETRRATRARLEFATGQVGEEAQALIRHFLAKILAETTHRSGKEWKYEQIQLPCAYLQIPLALSPQAWQDVAIENGETFGYALLGLPPDAFPLIPRNVRERMPCKVAESAD